MCSSSAYLVSCLLTIGCGDGTSGWILRDRSTGSSGTSEQAGGSSSGAGIGGSSRGGAGGAAAGAGGANQAGNSSVVDFSSVCSPEVIVDNRDSAGSGKLFDENVNDARAMVLALSQRTCELLYRSTSEVTVQSKIQIEISEFDGVATVGNGVIRLSSRHLQLINDTGEDVGSEIRGIICYMIAIMYQIHFDVPDTNWVWQGVANYVRHRAGFFPLDERSKGGSYRNGYEYSGFFFVWLEQQNPGFVYKLNQSFKDGEAWDPQIFETLTGKSLDDLWDEYQTTL
jgi:hypothetical protein